jgi:hypothetical protein
VPAQTLWNHAKRLLGGPFGHPYCLGPFRPCVTVAVHGNAGDPQCPEPFDEHLGAVSFHNIRIKVLPADAPPKAAS